MFVDVQAGKLPWREIYKLCISFINPRPIALVATRDRDGTFNLAPYSFYNMVCANPPVVFVSCGMKRDGGLKDTLRNVEQSHEFVVATVVPAIAERMVQCAAALPYGESEFAFAGLTPKAATTVGAPLVAESPVNIECTLREIKTIGSGPGSANLLFGNIQAIHVDDAVLDDAGVADPHKLGNVGRLGASWYANVASPYEMKIPEAGT